MELPSPALPRTPWPEQSTTQGPQSFPPARTSNDERYATTVVVTRNYLQGDASQCSYNSRSKFGTPLPYAVYYGDDGYVAPH